MTNDFKELLDRARLNGILRGVPDEPCQRLMTATISALEKMERENPGILAKKPPLAMLLAGIAKPCREVLARAEPRRSRVDGGAAA